ncbi:MAG: glycosyltransferase [Desulfovibrio sp.]|uniref:glycosyltransferase n=1 Tax=Desulfovibrio sp. 7SRBS1 TaxID=3378064 RepID=UPI003B3CFF8F
MPQVLHVAQADAETDLALLTAIGGRAHLQQAAAHVLALAGQGGKHARELFLLGRDLHFCALEAEPLDASAVTLALSLDKQSPFLGTPLRTELHGVLKATRQPEDIRYLSRLARQNQTAKLETYLANMTDKEPDNLFWLRHLISLRMAVGDFSGAMSLMSRPALKQFEQLRLRLSADILFQKGKYDRACATYTSALAGAPWIQARLRLAEALYREGNTPRAVRACTELLQAFPWHTNAALRRREYLTDRPKSSLSGRTNICLYTYNKADDLNQTLDALMASDLASDIDGAVVRVLDNGCTDATPEILSAWSNRVPRERFEVIRLPINIGAPAARNWLIQKCLDQETEWIAFLDDDAQVEPAWLSGFGQAVAAYPDAGAWGCKVVDQDNPAFIQSVDLHLLPPTDTPEHEGHLFHVARPHRQELDFGQYDYIRGCASVTGCLHLFRTATLKRSGGFDIRFSPSQYDDLDHDIRLCAAGTPPVYTGFVRVRHAKSTGKLASVSDSAYASGHANSYKLHMKHEPDLIRRIMLADREALRTDIQSALQGIPLAPSSPKESRAGDDKP